MNLILLAQTSFSTSTTGEPPGPLTWLLICAVSVFFVAVMWKVFTKAGQPGWKYLIPIYNMWILFEIGGKPGWWIFVPFANVIFYILATLEIARRFGKGLGFGLGLLFFSPIFYAILAFSDAQYQGNPAPAA